MTNTNNQQSEELDQILLQFLAEYHQGLNELAGHGTAQEQVKQRLIVWWDKAVREASIHELKNIPRTRSKQAYIESRLTQLESEEKEP